MSFLAPAALAGLALLAAPILIHLFRPRKTQRIPFSSLKWLKESSQEVSRRIEWHHWLLFLLRAGLLAMLVLALARPFWLGSDSSPPRDRFVIVDRSRSMDYHSADLPTPWQRATSLAAAAAKATRPGDRTAVLTIDHAPQIVGPLATDRAAAAQSLALMKPTFSDTRLGAALPLVQAMAASEADAARPIELVILSDFHLGSIQAAEVQRFVSEMKRPVRVRLVPLGVSGGNGWIANARALPRDEKGTWRIAVELGAAGDPTQSRTLRVFAAETEIAAATSIQLTAGRPTRVVVELTDREAPLGAVCRLQLDPPDALASDDTFDLPLYPAAPLKVVLIEPGEINAQGRTAGVHLRSAFESLESAGRQSLDVALRTPATLTPADLDGADVVVAASFPELATPLAEALKRRVEAGLGLAVFLGPKLPTDPAGDSLLTYRWQSPLAEPVTPAHLTRVDWNHSLLSALGDPQLADLPRSQFARYARVSPIAGAANQASILASFPDGTPAIVENRVGQGRVILFNTSANDAWGDLPLRRSFVPLVDRLLTHLAGRVGQQAFFVGESVNLPLPQAFSPESVRLVSPDGTSSQPRIESRAGRSMLAIGPFSEPGIYRLEPTNGVVAEPVSFAVRVVAGDRVLSAIDSPSLRSWWSPAEVEVLAADDAARAFSAEEAPGDWTPWLLLFAAVLLLAETLYGTWVTPLRTAEPSHGAGGSAP